LKFFVLVDFLIMYRRRGVTCRNCEITSFCCWAEKSTKGEGAEVLLGGERTTEACDMVGRRRRKGGNEPFV
jgi:hypothetical protein